MSRLSTKSCMFPFRMKQSSLAWLTCQWYGQYFGWSIQPISLGNFSSSKVRRLFSLTSNNLNTFSKQRSIYADIIREVRDIYPPSLVWVQLGTRPEKLHEQCLLTFQIFLGDNARV